MLGGGFKRGIYHNDIFDKIISLQNLFEAWREFRRGKRGKLDIQQFEFNLEDNLFGLHLDLTGGSWQHSHYTAFNVCDPKLRRIHKACVRDRVLHHAIFRVLYPIFDKSFIFDSYSCRVGKGTHSAVNRLEKFCYQASRNNQRNIFSLKCDVKKFFDSVDRSILLKLVRKKIVDEKALRLISDIIDSLGKDEGRGLPLGNVTSQLFANIYLNELDQFIKHNLRIRHYLRYCDDFIIMGENIKYLEKLTGQISIFLSTNLKLLLHPDKITIRKFHQGVDFLGYIVFPYHRILRTKTKRRILKKIAGKHRNLRNNLISQESFNQGLQSYFGVLKYCKGHKISQKIKNI